MLRLKAAAAALVVVAACGTPHPAELHTAAEPPAVVPEALPRVTAASTAEPMMLRAAPPAPTTTTTVAPPAPAPPPPPPVVSAPPPPPPQVSAASSPGCGGTVGDPGNDACWDRLAGCEAGGNWATNTGNGYYGGLQFALSSWRAVGGTGYPHEHPRAEQIARARMLWASGGWDHWPACTRSFGWR